MTTLALPHRGLWLPDRTLVPAVPEAVRRAAFALIGARRTLLSRRPAGGPFSAAPIDPAAVGGGQGWWRIDGGCDVSVDGSGIGSVTERFGNGYHLTEATNKPTYETNELNGYAVARFDGTNDKLQASFTHAQPLTTFVVAKQRSLTGTDYWLDGRVSPNTSAVTASGGVLSYWSTTQVTGGAITVGSWHIACAVFNGASSKLRQMGVVTATGNPGTSAADGITVGCAGSVAAFAEIDVAEVITYSGALSDASIAGIEAYLANRYGITS